MIFDGDLSKYHPTDALMFLSHLSLNGVLSIAHDDTFIALSIKDGHLCDAQSHRGDQKMLQCLQFQKVIDKAQRRHILQVQSETSMSVRQILGELNLLDTQATKQILTLGVQEVLLELFLLENGTFHFTDEDIGYDDTDIKIAIHPITLKVSAQADEFRDFEKTIQSLDQGLKVTSTTVKHPEQSNPETVLIQMAAANITVAQAIHQAPMGSYDAMKIIQNYLQAGVLELIKDPQAGPAIEKSPSYDPMFLSYKRALKKLLAAEDILQKTRGPSGFL